EKKNLRLLEVTASQPELVVKSISGGYLAQTPDVHTLSRAETQVKTRRAPDAGEWTALEFAWKNLQARQIQRHRVRASRAASGRRSGADEPRRFRQIRSHESRAAPGRLGGGLGRFLSVRG